MQSYLSPKSDQINCDENVFIYHVMYTTTEDFTVSKEDMVHGCPKPQILHLPMIKPTV